MCLATMAYVSACVATFTTGFMEVHALTQAAILIVFLLQVEEEHASLVKTKGELEQTKSQLEGEVAGGQWGGSGGRYPDLSVHVCVCVCAHMEERVVGMFINWI